MLTAHLDAAARLAGDALWSGEAGEIAARFIDELRDAANALPEIEPGGYAALFRALCRRQGRCGERASVIRVSSFSVRWKRACRASTRWS